MENNLQNIEGTDLGKIQIAPEVIEVIAGLAASEVEGVSSMSGGFVGEFVERFGKKKNLSRGVHVEVGQKEAAVDISIVVEYGFKIPKVAEEIQSNVRSAIENMTGLNVVEVNVHVVDVRIQAASEAESTTVVEEKEVRVR